VGDLVLRTPVSRIGLLGAGWAGVSHQGATVLCTCLLHAAHTTAALSNTAPVRTSILVALACRCACAELLTTTRGCSCTQAFHAWWHHHGMASMDSQHAVFLYQIVLQEHAISCTHAFRPPDSERRWHRRLCALPLAPQSAFHSAAADTAQRTKLRARNPSWYAREPRMNNIQLTLLNLVNNI
jgi:hypothetical protein